MSITSIKIDIEDVKRIDNDCKKILIRDNPELERMRLSRAYIVKRMINYFLID